MDELASHSIWAISIGAILLAKLGLVENRDISFDHHMVFAMSKWALYNNKVRIPIFKKYRIYWKLGEMYQKLDKWEMMNLTYLVSVFAFTIQGPIFAKLSTELVQVRRGWSEIGVQWQWIKAIVSLTLWRSRFFLYFRRNLCFFRHEWWLETGWIETHRFHTWVERLRVQRATFKDLSDIDVHLRVTDRGSSRGVDERFLIHGSIPICETLTAFWHGIGVVHGLIIGLVHMVAFFIVAALRFLISGMVICDRAWSCSTVLALCIAAVLGVWDTVREDHVVFLVLLMYRVFSHFWNFIYLLRCVFLKVWSYNSWLHLNLGIGGVAVDYNSWGGFWLRWRDVVSWAVLGVLRITSWTGVWFWLVAMRLKIVVFRTGFFLVLTSNLRHSSRELRLLEWST